MPTRLAIRPSPPSIRRLWRLRPASSGGSIADQPPLKRRRVRRADAAVDHEAASRSSSWIRPTRGTPRPARSPPALPNRPSGRCTARRCHSASSVRNVPTIPVSTGPWADRVAADPLPQRRRPPPRGSSRPRRPCSPSTRSAVSQRPSPLRTTPVLTIEPPPDASRWGIVWRMHRNTPVRLTAISRSPGVERGRHGVGVTGQQDAALLCRRRACRPARRRRRTAPHRRLVGDVNGERGPRRPEAPRPPVRWPPRRCRRRQHARPRRPERGPSPARSRSRRRCKTHLVGPLVPP